MRTVVVGAGALLCLACGSTTAFVDAPMDGGLDAGADGAMDGASPVVIDAGADGAVSLGTFQCEPFESQCRAGTETCCYIELGTNTCQPRGPSCPAGQAPLECGSSVNCPPGTVCCLDGTPDSVRSVKCEPAGSCTGAKTPTCRDDNDCIAPKRCPADVFVVRACR